MVQRVIFLSIIIAVSLYSKTYEIVESDIFNDVLQREDKILNNIKQFQGETQEKIKNYKGELLETADKNETYYIDPTYTLEQSIPKIDKNGNIIGVLYPKGFTFNPIKYTKTVPPKMVIFNPCSKKESEYIKHFIKKDSYVMLISSGCSQRNINWRDFGMSIYTLTEQIKTKLKITRTISIIAIDKDKERIRVDVIKP